MIPLLADAADKANDIADVWQIACYAEATVIAAVAVALLKSFAQNRADLRECLPLFTRVVTLLEKEERK